MEISFKDIHDAIVAEAKYGIPFPYESKKEIKSKTLKPEKQKRIKIAKEFKYRKIKRDISSEQVKDLILEKKKAGCSNCGYNRYMGALEFHHLDPSTKKFAITQASSGKLLNEILEELAKCVLLCSNCHREVHGGLIKL